MFTEAPAIPVNKLPPEFVKRLVRQGTQWPHYVIGTQFCLLLLPSWLCQVHMRFILSDSGTLGLLFDQELLALDLVKHLSNGCTNVLYTRACCAQDRQYME